jgi:Transcriptional regulator containing PAS, AAA-type ATPase, and DNA-binding domains
MNTLHLTKEELNKKYSTLRELMDQVFDVSILVDENCKILYVSRGSVIQMPSAPSFVGKDISSLDTVSPFRKVIAECKSYRGLLLEIQGRKCISSIFPIKDPVSDTVIGALGTIIFRNMNRVKSIFSESSSTAEEIGDIYDTISRFAGVASFDDFIGDDHTVTDLKEKARKAAASKLPVLIIGETGTGKEIIAGAIHASRYQNVRAPYVTINCTAIPENLLESELFGYEKGAFTGADASHAGRFEAAAGGDILLDEIGDMNLSMQSKLLRVLESKEFERVGGNRVIPLTAGIIASTNQNLFTLSEEKKFRSDLYFRLNAIELFIPPLRKRVSDIPGLVDHFCEDMNVKPDISPSGMSLLMNYAWPGNVRQLKNLTQRLAIFYEGRQITSDDIANELRIGQRTYNEAFGFTKEDDSTPLSVIENTERSAIIIAMKNHRGNISAAAAELGVSRGTMYNKIKKYGLERNGSDR